MIWHSVLRQNHDGQFSLSGQQRPQQQLDPLDAVIDRLDGSVPAVSAVSTVSTVVSITALALLSTTTMSGDQLYHFPQNEILENTILCA